MAALSWQERRPSAVDQGLGQVQPHTVGVLGIPCVLNKIGKFLIGAVIAISICFSAVCSIRRLLRLLNTCQDLS